jgi:hypothetical protein
MPLRTKLDHVYHGVRAVTKLCPLVVIAEDETDLPVEAGEVSQRVRAPEGEVPEMPHHVAPPDPSIPPSDHLLIHLTYRGEGTIAVADDVLVPEMCVSREPHRLPL